MMISIYEIEGEANEPLPSYAAIDYVPTPQSLFSKQFESLLGHQYQSRGALMMKFISDPRLFNFILIAIYAANIIRWACARSVADTAYWVGALIITVAVTFGYQR